MVHLQLMGPTLHCCYMRCLILRVSGEHGPSTVEGSYLTLLLHALCLFLRSSGEYGPSTVEWSPQQYMRMHTVHFTVSNVTPSWYCLITLLYGLTLEHTHTHTHTHTHYIAEFNKVKGETDENTVKKPGQTSTSTDDVLTDGNISTAAAAALSAASVKAKVVCSCQPLWDAV